MIQIFRNQSLHCRCRLPNNFNKIFKCNPMDSANLVKMSGKLKKKPTPNTKAKSQISFDGKPVYKLYLRNLPHLITENDLRYYFCRYGVVTSVQIHKKGSNNRVYKYGLVHFKHAASAGAASRDRTHFICNRKIIARPADSLSRRPDSDQKNRGKPTRTKRNNLSENVILNLNDDCLLHLCSFLSLADKISLSQTCERFNGIVETMCHHEKTLTITENEKITLMQLRQIFLKAGHDLRQIKLNNIKDSASTLELISQSCRNLKELRVDCKYLSDSNPSDVQRCVSLNTFKEIGLQLCNLTKIELSNCKIDDDDCHHLIPLQNLEYMDLSRNPKLTGRHLDKFHKLIHLDLYDCEFIELRFFKSICENGLLKWLNIDFCYFNPSCVSNAFLKLKHLECLTFIAPIPNGVNKISQLKSLKSLTVVNANFLDMDFFKNLAQNNSVKLESLSLFGEHLCSEKLKYICEFKNLKKLYIHACCTFCDSFAPRLSELKQLKFLGLVCCITKPKILITLFKELEIRMLDITANREITDGVIFEIAETIKKRGTPSHCTIYVARTEVSKRILKNKRYLEYRPFLAVSFKKYYADMLP